MRVYKISTTEKKNIRQVEQWGSDKYSFDIEQWWRWGYVTIEVRDDEEFDIEAITENKNGFWATDYSIIDQEMDDGVAMDINTYGNEELREEVDAMFEDEGYLSLEEAGYSCEDIETTFFGKLEVELLEQYDDPPITKGSWPN